MIYIASLILGLISTATDEHILPKKVDNKVLFLISRLLFLTLAGAVLGLLGFLIKINGTMGGILLIISSIVILFIALSHLPIFPKVVVIGLKGHHHSTKAVAAGFSNIFVSSPTLHIVMVAALAHGYYLESGGILLAFTLGSSIKIYRASLRLNKFVETLQILVFILITLFVLNKGLLYSQLYHLSFFEHNRTAIVPEVLDGSQFFKTNLKSIENRLLIDDDMPLKWVIEGKGETIYIPSYRHKSVIDQESDFLELDNIDVNFIYFTRGLGKGDYILKTTPNVEDYYNLPYKKVIDSGFGSIHDEEETITYPEIKVKDMAVAYKDGTSQRVDITVNSEGYSPSIIVLQQGVPAILNFRVEELSDETYRILIPSYNEQLEFKEGDNPVNISDPLVDFTFYSWVGSYGGYVLVAEDLQGMTLEKAQRQVKMLNVDGI